MVLDRRVRAAVCSGFVRASRHVIAEGSLVALRRNHVRIGAPAAGNEDRSQRVGAHEVEALRRRQHGGESPRLRTP